MSRQERKASPNVPTMSRRRSAGRNPWIAVRSTSPRQTVEHVLSCAQPFGTGRQALLLRDNRPKADLRLDAPSIVDKRYQFFISSTFTDLKEQRQAVLRAVLELNHMPAGMELFPASDESAWQLIRDVIDASDYYILIVGGRYGSTDEAGLGYTEKEYDYAVDRKKPVLAFLHEDPVTLPRQSTDTDKAAWQKLLTFREKLKKNHTLVMWTSAGDLKAKVIVAVTSQMKRRPASGWVRADQVPSAGTVTEVLALRSRVSELEKELQETSLAPPPDTEDLAQGDDVVSVRGDLEIGQSDFDFMNAKHPKTIHSTWNEIFGSVAPTMINEASEFELFAVFRSLFERIVRDQVEMDLDEGIKGFHVRDEQIQTFIVQFRALGLIRASVRQRSVKDTNAYWKLTVRGDHRMTMLRAIRKRRN